MTSCSIHPLCPGSLSVPFDGHLFQVPFVIARSSQCFPVYSPTVLPGASVCCFGYPPVSCVYCIQVISIRLYKLFSASGVYHAGQKRLYSHQAGYRQGCTGTSRSQAPVSCTPHSQKDITPSLKATGPLQTTSPDVLRTRLQF